MSSINIYVGNLTLEVTGEELRREFMAFGEVISITVMNDKYGSGQSWGCGFVEMASKSEGEAAVTGLNGKTIRGRVIEVVEALPLSGRKDKMSFHSRRGSRFNRQRQRGY